MGYTHWCTGLLFLISVAATGQPYYFRRYDADNGLPSAAVYAIIQDQQGFMWFGTKEGIARFDGYRFKTYDTDPPGTASTYPKSVMAFALDPSGDLWAGTERCLLRYDKHNDRFIPLFDSLHQVWGVSADNKGNIWFIADTVLYCYPPGGRLRRYGPPQFPPAITLATGYGYVWFASTDGRLHRLEPAKSDLRSYDLFSHSPPATFKWISTIREDGQGGLFIGTYTGVKYFDCPSGVYRDIPLPVDTNASPHTLAIAQSTPDHIWFGTESGLYVCDRNGGNAQRLATNAADPYSLSYNEIWTIYQDREGGMWVGTFLGGLDYCPLNLHPLFEKYFAGSATGPLSGTLIGDVCEDRLKNIWIATEDGGLDRLDRKTSKIDWYTPKGKPGTISSLDIKTLLSDGDKLWAGTNMHGLDVLDIHTGRVIRHYSAGSGAGSLKSDFITCLLKDDKGRIDVGTDRSLFRYDPRTDQFKTPALAPPGASITCLLQDHTGGIWLGTHGKGLYFIDSAEQHRLQLLHKAEDSNSLTNDVINTMLEDPHHSLWLGLEGGGICILSPDHRHISRIGERQGLPSNFVFKLLCDARGVIWAATSRGLTALDSSGHILTVYTQANGLLNNDFNYNSGCRAADGLLYFGSTRGVIAFRPDNIQNPEPVPTVYITGFQVNNKDLVVDEKGPLKQSLLLTRQISLPHDQGSISIDFAALSFQSPALIGYRYRLEGMDQDWTSLRQNRRVYFTGLKPGHYTFRVAPTGEDITQTNECTLEIDILPPFWATSWAIVVYGALLLALCWYGWRTFDHRQQLKKESAHYSAKVQLFTLVAHEIRTPLTLIVGPLENLREAAGHLETVQPELKTIETNTRRLLELVDQLLDLQKMEAQGFSLAFAQLDIARLIREVWQAFESAAIAKDIAFELQLPETPFEIAADKEVLYKILSNLFSNAIKYADKIIRIRIATPASDDTTISIEVSNDGRTIPKEMKEMIFEPFQRLRTDGFQRGTGLGLALARSLTTLLGGQLYLRATTDGLNTIVLVLNR